MNIPYGARVEKTDESPEHVAKDRRYRNLIGPFVNMNNKVTSWITRIPRAGRDKIRPAGKKGGCWMDR